MSWAGGLFAGSNPTLNNNIVKFGNIGGFATGLGEKNLTEASKFMSGITSGDSSKIFQLLGPQIGAAKNAAQQSTKTRTMFGSRSGGTGAANAATSDKVHSDITSMIADLTGGAVSGLASTGGSLLSEGMNAYNKQTELSQQQIENWKNSILGQSISGAAKAGEAFATGGVGGVAAGGSFAKGGAAALSNFNFSPQ